MWFDKKVGSLEQFKALYSYKFDFVKPSDRDQAIRNAYEHAKIHAGTSNKESDKPIKRRSKASRKGDSD